MAKKKTAKRPPAKKKPRATTTRPTTTSRSLQLLFAAAEARLAVQIAAMAAPYRERIDALEQRVEDFAATLTVVKTALDELQKFDQYIFDAVKRHEETYHQPVGPPETVATTADDAAAAPWPPGSI